MSNHPEFTEATDGLPIVGHAQRTVLALGHEAMVGARRIDADTVQVVFTTVAGAAGESGIRVVTLTANRSASSDARLLSWSVRHQNVTRTPDTECVSRKGTISHALPVLEAFWARAGANN